MTYILIYILSFVFFNSAFSQWRFPDCNDLAVTKIEFVDPQHDTLLISVYNECDSCVQHVYTGLIAYENDDTIAVDEFLSGRSSPPNNGQLNYTLITKKYFEIEDIDRIQMAFGLCDSLHFSSLIDVDIDNWKIKNPSSFLLFQNYPNPFNPATKIDFHIPKASYITLRVFDCLGNEIETLLNEYKIKGSYSVKFDASHLSSGLYFYQMIADEFTSTKQMLLLK
ncbi:MAG: T9SS type A sorting domain-containing protein [Nitrososphaerales archaeon]